MHHSKAHVFNWFHLSTGTMKWLRMIGISPRLDTRKTAPNSFPVTLGVFLTRKTSLKSPSTEPPQVLKMACSLGGLVENWSPPPQKKKHRKMNFAQQKTPPPGSSDTSHPTKKKGPSNWATCVNVHAILEVKQKTSGLVVFFFKIQLNTFFGCQKFDQLNWVPPALKAIWVGGFFWPIHFRKTCV